MRAPRSSPVDAGRTSIARTLVGLALVGVAAWVAHSFHAAAWLYQGYPQPAYSISGIPALELSFDMLYLVYGVAFAGALMGGLALTGLAPRVAEHLSKLVGRRALPAMLAALVGVGALAVRFWILDRQVVTDDEETYRFIAQTLLEGRVANPLPVDPEFFANQFIVLGKHGWYGKYPIGHPLVLAAALRLGLTDLAVPALGAATAWVTWRLGRLVQGPRRALTALVLLALSPHFVWTHGTLLSQTTACLAAMVGLLCLAHWQRGFRAAWLAGAGAALGFALLVRPLPGGLYPMLAAGLIAYRLRGQWRRLVSAAFVFGGPVLVGAAVLGLVNFIQSGSPLRSGYHEVHASLGVGAGQDGIAGMSLLGGMLRENFWLFGWPLSLVPALFARPTRRTALLLVPVAAAIAYRLAVPKTVVSTTGPTYLLEAVPVLALLSAEGLARLRALLGRAYGRGAGAHVGSGVLSLFAASAVFFLPVQTRAVRQGVEERRVVFRLLEENQVDRAVVFSTMIAAPGRLTWAFSPPNPPPRLDDPILFFHLPSGQDGAARAARFWRKSFPDRPAFVFSLGSPPRLTPLSAPP